ncbi:MAG: HD domain-containing protein [Clostridia bacterium]|nr:HD domain-containing protein [Clostridia bacterium]
MQTYEAIRAREDIKTYITLADRSLKALGYTEHSFAHVTHTAETVKYILTTQGHSSREVELGMIAAYLHDIGNLINRVDHSQSGAMMAFSLLREMQLPPEEIATVVTAIGNHDEGSGVPVNPIAAALILADKSDVRRSRVRNQEFAQFDIHDRVNYSVKKSWLSIDEEQGQIRLTLEVDTQFSSVTDFFEIFLTRMRLCRRAAETLGLEFKLIINGQMML